MGDCCREPRRGPRNPGCFCLADTAVWPWMVGSASLPYGSWKQCQLESVLRVRKWCVWEGTELGVISGGKMKVVRVTLPSF